MNNQTHYEVKCPYPDCYATVQLSYTKPIGIYDCKCLSCQIRLSWDTCAAGQPVAWPPLVNEGEATE